MYNESTPTDEPIEIRFASRGLVLSAWRTPAGTIAYSLQRRGIGMPESLINLQARGTFPSKAVVGWQAEAVRAAGSGVYAIAEVR